MATNNIIKKYHDLKRLTVIVETLFHYGLAELFDRSTLAKKFPFIISKEQQAKVELSTPERVRLALEELGPTFVKLGQLLSTRPDIIPSEYLVELQKLQDRVTPFPFEEVLKIITESLGVSVQSIFKKIDPDPIASASIAQVHLAYLKSGKKVALKIQRPNIEKIISSDTQILLELATFLKNRELVDEIWQPVEIAQELKRSIEEELNFENEIHNIKIFSNNFAQEKNIKCYHVYEEYSGQNLITMEYIDGVKMSKIIADKRKLYPKKEIARIGADAILKQIFVDHFFHGDLHPGNLFWLKKEHQIAFIDFGLAGHLGDADSRTIVMMIYGVINKDSEKILMAIEGLDVLKNSKQITKLRTETDLLLEKYWNAELKDLKISEVIGEIFGLMLKYKVRLPANLVMFAKTLITVEGVAASLDPEFNMFNASRPYIQAAIEREFQGDKFKKEGENLLWKSVRLLKSFPEDFYWLLKNLKNNDFQIKVAHRDLEKLLSEIAVTGNRLSFSIIVAGLIIGSSYVIPNFQILGLIGYSLASLMGLILAITMFTKRKL